MKCKHTTFKQNCRANQNECYHFRIQSMKSLYNLIFVMGKIVDDQNHKQCPICYSEIEHVTQPKRCKHRFCQQCLTHWIKKGKKNCPLCRKGFSSIFKIRKQQRTKANGRIVEKQKRQQIKNQSIRLQIPSLIASTTQDRSQSFLSINQLVIPGFVTFMIPPFPILNQHQYVYPPSYCLPFSLMRSQQ